MKATILLYFILISNAIFAQVNFVEVQKSISITRAELLEYGYNPSRKPDASTDKQPFATKDEIENFLSQMLTRKSTEFPVQISSWLTQNLTSYNNNASLIFINHPLSLSQLFSKDYETTAESYRTACNDNIEKTKHLNVYKTEYEKLFTDFESNQKLSDILNKLISSLDPKKDKIKLKQKKTESDKLSKENLSLITRLGQLRILIESHEKDVIESQKKMEELQSVYESQKKFFLEDTSKLMTTILNKENYEWSDYLLDKKNIMLVFVGGIKSFKNYEIEIKNDEKKHQKDFKDLILVVKAVVPSLLGDEIVCDPKEPKQEEIIPVTFLLLKRNKIDPPSSINFLLANKEKKNIVTIHEKSLVGIKIGVSLVDIERKQFVLNSSNQLSINTDSLKANEFKLNMMALLELYPFGRDYDRLKSVWESNNIPFYERIGLVGGVKISKDPLESIFVGGSFAMSKSFNIVSGIVFNKTAKDQDSLQVGINTTLDYLKRNADTELKPRFYIGISVSPGQILKLLAKKD